MRGKTELGQPTFALTTDVSEAHRQVPAHPSDWHFLGCQVTKNPTVFVNTVGTFGITSASFCWNRVGAAVGRISQFVVGKLATTWRMLVADDYHLEAGGEQYRFALIAFFIVCAVAGVPLSWNKTSGGESVTWVGFELVHKTRQLGISQRRADWFRRWTSEVAGSSTVHLGSFEEGLGRVMFVAGALEYERPFLGPLYNFLALHPRDSVRAVPPYVSFFLRYLADQIAQCRQHDCSSRMCPDQLAPRVYAQASAERTGIGGWFPHVDQSGKVNIKASRWFSHEITRDEWPWVFEKSPKPALVISTLEALAVLVALKVYYGQELRTDRNSIRIVPTTTDNRGNGAALNKLMTTRYPAAQC